MNFGQKCFHMSLGINAMPTWVAWWNWRVVGKRENFVTLSHSCLPRVLQLRRAWGWCGTGVSSAGRCMQCSFGRWQWRRHHCMPKEEDDKIVPMGWLHAKWAGCGMLLLHCTYLERTKGIGLAHRRGRLICSRPHAAILAHAVLFFFLENISIMKTFYFLNLFF